MARATGRRLRVLRGAARTPLAALRTKAFSIAREAIDVSTDDDGAWRVLLAEPGQRSVDASFAGVTEDDVLIAAIMSGGVASFEDLTIELPSGLWLLGDFFFGSLSLTGEYNQAVTFEGEMLSSGPILVSQPLLFDDGSPALFDDGSPAMTE